MHACTTREGVAIYVRGIGLATAALLAISAPPAQGAPGDTHRISAGESPPALSADGRYVAFRWDGYADPQRYFTNWHIYLADRATNGIARISDSTTVWEPRDDDYVGQNVAVSAGGRYLAWMSQRWGENWTMKHELLVHDRQTGVTEHVAAFDGESPDRYLVPSSHQVSISRDGRYVAFDTMLDTLVPGDTNGSIDVFVYDRATKAFTRASVASGGTQANGPSRGATLSSSGRYVAYWSAATNLVPGDTNAVPDVFLHDRVTGKTGRMSVNSAGQQIRGWRGIDLGGHFNRPALSADARYVAFVATTGDRTRDGVVFLRDRVAATTRRIDSGANGAIAHDAGGVSLSADGRYVAFVSRSPLVTGDRNAAGDVFVRDRVTGDVEIASVQQNGLQLSRGEQPSLSADGRLVAFFSYDRDSGRRNEAVYVHELGGTRIWGYRLIGGADFGRQALGTIDARRYYVVENTGGVELPIAKIELRGSDASHFAVQSRCGASVAPGARCNVVVSFVPKTIGQKTARLAVVFELREGRGVAVKQLTGEGI